MGGMGSLRKDAGPFGHGAARSAKLSEPSPDPESPSALVPGPLHPELCLRYRLRTPARTHPDAHPRRCRLQALAVGYQVEGLGLLWWEFGGQGLGCSGLRSPPPKKRGSQQASGTACWDCPGKLRLPAPVNPQAAVVLHRGEATPCVLSQQPPARSQRRAQPSRCPDLPLHVGLLSSAVPLCSGALPRAQV